MEQTISSWRFDPEDPRAPSQAVWDGMSADERQRVVAMLPVDPIPLQTVPPGEGDAHYDAVRDTRDVLQRWFQKRGRRAYVGVNKAVYYPGERVFSPDVFAVLDAEPGPRQSWLVSQEGRGLDFALELHVAGDRSKDLKHNVERYARLGIPEYFVFELVRQRLWGWRLPTTGESYERLLAQQGFFRSDVLDLELGLVSGRLRFHYAGATLPDTHDLLTRLERAVDDVTTRAEEEARRAEEEARRAEEEARRAEEEARRAEEEARRAEELAQRVAELEAQLARLRGETD